MNVFLLRLVNATAPTDEKIIIGGDFNGHVEKDKQGYKRIHGGSSFGGRNEAEENILDFAIVFDLIVNNTFFKKRRGKKTLITFKN